METSHSSVEVLLCFPQIVPSVELNGCEGVRLAPVEVHGGPGTPILHWLCFGVLLCAHPSPSGGG